MLQTATVRCTSATETLGDTLDDLEESKTITLAPDLIRVFSFNFLLHDVGTLSPDDSVQCFDVFFEERTTSLAH